MDALVTARRRLDVRLLDKKLVMVPGLVEDLRAIAGAFEEIEGRTDRIAAFMLRTYVGGPLPVPRAQLESLARMGPEAAAVFRIMEHGPRCTCQDCMRNR